jgi:hypothetical protein
MELYGKLRYIGRDFPISLTNGKVYYYIGVDNGMIRIVDHEEEDYLYPTSNPKHADV